MAPEKVILQDHRMENIITRLAGEFRVAFKCGRKIPTSEDPFLAEIILQLAYLCDRPETDVDFEPADVSGILALLQNDNGKIDSTGDQIETIDAGLLAQIAEELGAQNGQLRNQQLHELVFAVMRRYRVSDATNEAKVWVLPTQANVFGWNAPSKEPAVSDLQINPFVKAVTEPFPRPDTREVTISFFGIRYRIPWLDVMDFNNYIAKVKRFVERKARQFLKKATYDIHETGEAKEQSSRLFLDGEFHDIRDGDLIAIRKAGERKEPVPYRVIEARIRPRTAYRLTGNATDIHIEGEWWQPTHTINPDTFETIQNTRVFCEARQLKLAEEPLPPTHRGVNHSSCDATCQKESPASASQRELNLNNADTLVLNSIVEHLTPGQQIAVEGKVFAEATSSDSNQTVHEETDDTRSEVVRVLQVSHEIRSCLFGDRFVTKLVVDRLKNPYLRSSISINANLVGATHGKTTLETVGDGNGAKPFLKHRLTSLPLSRVPATTGRGYESQLDVFVNDVRWSPQTSFIEAHASTEAYVLHDDYAGGTTVVFGDGNKGSRSPTGVDNIHARYRFGLGAGGNVAVGRIDQVAGSPIGVTGVINPVSAVGGADPDDAEQTRVRAPLAVSAFDRIVSERDYKDFALIFAGVGKAHSQYVDGTVYLTIAANHPGPIPTNSDLYRNLGKAIRDNSDPIQQPFSIRDRRISFLALRAEIEIEPAQQWAVVNEQLRKALLKRFDYDSARFGEELFLSDAVAVMHAVAGVISVKVTVFRKIDSSTLVPSTQKNVSATLPTSEGNQVRPAEICFLSPDIPGTIQLVQPSNPRKGID